MRSIFTSKIEKLPFYKIGSFPKSWNKYWKFYKRYMKLHSLDWISELLLNSGLKWVING